MEQDMTLTGRLFFDSPAIAQFAREEARELLMEEDPRFRKAVAGHFFESFVVNDNVIDVALRLRGPEHFWFGVESLAEALSLRASDGHLEGRTDRFGADVEQFVAGGEIR